MDAGLERAQTAVAALVRDRRVILTGGALQGLTGQAEMLRSWGARELLILGLGEGTGPVPPPGMATFVIEEIAAGDLFTLLHGQDQVLADLPVGAQEAIDRFDPEGEAVVVAGSWTTLTSVGGRRVLGSRPTAWAALEDKTRIDALAHAAGVAVTPAQVVDATEVALASAARTLDEGAGTVWAGDASAGINGGGDLVRWVTPGGEREHVGLFAARCAQVRVAAFREGVPCSIHGFVTPQATIVLRPVEVLSLRRPDGGFLLAGTASWWDPPAAERSRMREVARRVGELLRTRYGYRGAFGIDGILTPRGFEITELNPRLSAGFHTLAAASPIPFALLDIALREGADLDHPQELEQHLVELSDQHRRGRGYSAWAGGAFSTTSQLRVRLNERACQLPDDDGVANATITTGPSPGGGFLAVDPDPDAVSLGTSFAPTVAAAFAFADSHLGTTIGPLIDQANLASRTSEPTPP